VNFDPFRSHVWSFAPGDTTRTDVAHGNGKFDGVEVLADGRILYSSWTDSSVHIVDGASDVRALISAPGAADLGVDTKRNRVLVPVSMADRVDVWQLGPRPRQ
jgi:hypothetical protein